jgi:hypothetical protein
VTLGVLVVRVHSLLKQPCERLHVVNTDSSLDNALGRAEVHAGVDKRGEELKTVVRDTLEGGILAGGDVGVCLVGEEEVEDVRAVVADGCAEGRVDAVLLLVGVDLCVEEDLD